jgi:hypothetical protein
MFCKPFQLMLCILFSISILISLSSCSGSEAPKAPNAKEITSLGKHCKELEGRQIDAWNSKDSENLRQVYTDDAVHFDSEPVMTGIDNMIALANGEYISSPNWQMKAGESYISRDQCLGTWISWNLFGITQDDPGTEYDLLDFQEDKISYWRLFYDPRFKKALGGIIIDPDFLSQFASGWSEGNAAELTKLYSEDAMLEDSLYRVKGVGQPAIQNYVSSFFARSPGANWVLINSFGEGKSRNFSDLYPRPSQGGVFAIKVTDAGGNPCEIRVAVILTPNEEKKIEAQKVFYNADTLLACGWAK